MKNILLVIPNVPFPLVTGGQLRDWQILQILHRMGIKPHVLYFGAGEGYDLAAENPIQKLVASLSYAGPRIENPDRGIKDKVKRKLNYLIGSGLRGADSGNPDFPFSYQYDAIGAGEIIVEHALKVKAEIVILRSFWCHHAPALKSHGLQVIANCPDYNTKLALEMVKGNKEFIKKIGPFCNYIGIRRQERTFLPFCDEVWVPTINEAKEITFLSTDKILVFPNLIDVKRYPDMSENNAERYSLLFLANFFYLPNANAAESLIQDIFPAVKEKYPAAKLYLIGKGLAPALQEIAQKRPGITITGWVDDLEEYFQKAEIFVSPVKDGAGMMFKVLEALSFGKPVVGLRESFRGIPGGDGQAFIAVDSTHDLINNILELMVSEEKRKVLGRNARKLADRELSFEKGISILDRSIINHS